MFRISLRSLLAHKLRMAMSVFAVVLGTAFVSGALVFGASLTSILDGAFTGSAVDLQVSAEARGRRRRVRPAVDGHAEGRRPREGPRRPRRRARRRARSSSSASTCSTRRTRSPAARTAGPGQGLAWLGTGGTAKVSAGAAPAADDEVVLDERTADAAGVGVGDQATVLLANGARQQFRCRACSCRRARISASRPRSPSPRPPPSGCSSIRAPGRRRAVTLAAGADPGTVKAAVASSLGTGYTVKTRAEQVQEAKDTAGKFVNIFTYVLLGFAVVALLVGGFLIFNTFSMVVAQRAREMALLRAVGARRKQVSRALLGEAAVVGLVGSVIGLVLGLLVAVGLGKLLGVIGLDLTITPVGAGVRGGWCLVLGVGITLLAAWIPTRRAGRTSPVAALQESGAVKESQGPGPPRDRPRAARRRRRPCSSWGSARTAAPPRCCSRGPVPGFCSSSPPSCSRPPRRSCSSGCCRPRVARPAGSPGPTPCATRAGRRRRRRPSPSASRSSPASPSSRRP